MRVVADSHLRTRLTSRLVATAAQTPTWLIARDGADPERRRALEGGRRGRDRRWTPARRASIWPRRWRRWPTRGITRVLVEGGAQLAAALLRADLVDRLAWFHAPAVMGGDGWPAAQAFGIERLAAMPRFVRALGDRRWARIC